MNIEGNIFHGHVLTADAAAPSSMRPELAGAIGVAVIWPSLAAFINDRC